MTSPAVSGIAGLSRRGRRLVDRPPFPEYLQEHFARLATPYDATSRPDGYIALSVAENLLLGEPLVDRLAAVERVPPRVLGYDSMVGSQRFREQLSRFLGRTFLGREFPPEQIAALAGAGSVLEILFHNLCDPGDGVLVPTPSYAGFWADLENRDELTIVPVHTRSADGFRLTPELLERSVAEAGRPVKALLFTSPNNPLGCVYSRSEIEEIVRWSRSAGVHLVFDEIYALSVYGEEPFTSVAQLLPELGDSIHIVWAFSKDFGASGLRCGVLVSENGPLLQSVDALAYWAAVSGHTQYLLGEAIADQAWVDEYLRRVRETLAHSHRRVTAALDEAGIPYLPAGAGFFLVCDFRRFLDDNSWEGERRLWRRLIERTNVNLTPGEACRNAEPGFLRLCFAAVPPEAVVTGVQRIAAALKSGASG